MHLTEAVCGQALKAEIGVFFPMILLRAVEPVVQGATPNTSGDNPFPPLFAFLSPSESAMHIIVLSRASSQCRWT